MKEVEACVVNLRPVSHQPEVNHLLQILSNVHKGHDYGASNSTGAVAVQAFEEKLPKSDYKPIPLPLFLEAVYQCKKESLVNLHSAARDLVMILQYEQTDCPLPSNANPRLFAAPETTAFDGLIR